MIVLHQWESETLKSKEDFGVDVFESYPSRQKKKQATKGYEMLKTSPL